ncbi:MAG: hypothetical protein ACYCW5_05025 [Thermoleophilia bacterium]
MTNFLNNKRRLALLAATISIVGIAAVYSLLLFSARSSASDAIQQADTAINRAMTASTPGSEEAAALNRSETSLNNARDSFNSASFFHRSAYIDAGDEAATAAVAANSLLDRLATDFSDTTEALGQLNFEKAFEFYKKYPQTDEARTILASAETTLNASISPLSATVDNVGLETLDKIDRFNLSYPTAERPQSIIDGTGNLLVDFAFRNVATLGTIAEQNRAGLEKLVSTGQGQQFTSLPDNFVNSAKTISGYMPNLYMPPEMGMMFSALIEANTSAVEFKTTMTDASSRMMDENDVAILTGINQKLIDKMDEAQTHLSNIKAQGYTGSEAGQAGYAAGMKAAENAKANN